MLKYCAKKIAQLLIVLVLISFFSFGIIYFAPGDVSSMYITQDMTDEQKELFSRYTDAVREYQPLAECLLFQNSFKLGAKMMLEVMSE